MISISLWSVIWMPCTLYPTGSYAHIRVSVDTLYRDGANDVSRERIQTAPLAHPGRAS